MRWRVGMILALLPLVSGCGSFGSGTAQWLRGSQKAMTVLPGQTVTATVESVFMGKEEYYRIYGDCAAAVVPAP